MNETNHIGSTPHPNSYLRLPQIIGDRKRGTPALVPVSPSTWWHWVSIGKAPKPHKLGPKITAWRASEVFALLEKLSVDAGQPDSRPL